MVGNSKKILITKHSGEREVFSPQKLRSSLESAGAGPKLAKEVCEEITGQVRGGMTTAAIYRAAFRLLRNKKRGLAARYNLKEAIFQMGPAGYPFERFVAKILERQGYQTQVGAIVAGKCVRHEVDVVAQKGKEHFLVECKFHNQGGIKSDVKVALYVKARFEDIKEGFKSLPEHKQEFHQIWLVTNTKFTQDAIKFAECAGIRAIGWNHPKRESLQALIEGSGLHPLTCLSTLSSFQKRLLLEQGIVLCQEIKERPETLKMAGLRGIQVKALLQEISGTCGV